MTLRTTPPETRLHYPRIGSKPSTQIFRKLLYVRQRRVDGEEDEDDAVTATRGRLGLAL